jgi:hypothetical protein
MTPLVEKLSISIMLQDLDPQQIVYFNTLESIS